MKKITKILCIVLVAAVLFGMVLTANAYKVIDKSSSSSVTKTTNAAGTTYVYDFKNADGSLASVSKYTTRAVTSGTYEVSINNNGLSFMGKNGSGSGANGNLGGWLFECYLYDPDFMVGANSSSSRNKALNIEAGHYYEITVQWQCTVAGKFMTLVRSTVGGDLNGTSGVISATNTTNGYAQSANSTAANTDMTSTFVIDGDGITAGSSNANCYIGLAGNNGATYLFKKVTVTVYDKAALTVADNQLTINFDNGFKDIYVPRVDVNGAGTLEIAQDPNNTGRGNVLKMTTTKTSGTTFQFGLAVKPGLGNYKAAINNQLPGVDGYQVTLGNSYRVSYDVYCEDYDEGIAQTYACYLSTEAGIGAVGGKDSQTKLNYKNVSISTLQNGAGNGKWIHVEYTIKATSANNGTYLLIGLGGTTPNTVSGTEDYAAIVYFDNIVVTDVTNAPQNYAAESKRSIRAESGTGENYVSAGLRFRAEIPTATANAAEEIGFIVAPEKHVTDYGANWYDMTSGTPAMSTAKVAKCTNTLYGVNGSNNQYQLLISKLTQENENANLKDTYFTVVLYVKATDGTYTYYNVATSSYREVVNAYISNDASNASKY